MLPRPRRQGIMAARKSVLVQFMGHGRPVSFVSDSSSYDIEVLRKAVTLVYEDYELAGKKFFLKRKRGDGEDWSGQYVDIEAEEVIADKSVIKIQVVILASIFIHLLCQLFVVVVV